MAETMTMHWLDWVVVALFFVLVLWIGIRSGKSINSSTDFLLAAARSLGGCRAFPITYPVTPA